MVESVNVIGRGRVGSALAARLEERGVELREDGELALLCVPDTAIRDVARGLSLGHGRWVAHVSGAMPLAALDPHERRFSLHPLQTFTLTRGPEQLDGAWAAVTAETDEARALGFELTGPIERGDWETVEAHREAIRSVRPDLEPLYDTLAEATAR